MLGRDSYQPLQFMVPNLEFTISKSTFYLVAVRAIHLKLELAGLLETGKDLNFRMKGSKLARDPRVS